MSTGLPIGLLLVDDDPLIRAGLATILASDPDIKVLGEAENGVRAIELVTRLQPQVIMMGSVRWSTSLLRILRPRCSS